jgi:hypothetical protein
MIAGKIDDVERYDRYYDIICFLAKTASNSTDYSASRGVSDAEPGRPGIRRLCGVERRGSGVKPSLIFAYTVKPADTSHR